MTDGDIVTDPLDKNNIHTESSSDSEPEAKLTTLRDIASAVDIIPCGLETPENISEKRFLQLSEIEHKLMKKQKQTTIHFFLRNKLCITMIINVS